MMQNPMNYYDMPFVQRMNPTQHMNGYVRVPNHFVRLRVICYVPLRTSLLLVSGIFSTIFGSVDCEDADGDEAHLCEDRMAMAQLYSIAGARHEAYLFLRGAFNNGPQPLQLVETDFSVHIYKGDIVRLLHEAKLSNDWTNVYHNGAYNTPSFLTHKVPCLPFNPLLALFLFCDIAIHGYLRRAGVFTCQPSVCALIYRYMMMWAR
jgi:hypothetical protein